MPGVFISYRRADSSHWANRLSNHLSLRFGKDLVFEDVEDIKYGENFFQVIQQAIESAEVVLVIIGPDWIKGKLGQRLHQPSDVLRREITLSLKSAETVIPILVGGAAMPSTDKLPQSIKGLAARHAATLRENRWRADVANLIERIRELLVPTRDQYSLPHVQLEMSQAQQRFFEILPDPTADARELARKTADALEFAQKMLAYLDRVLPLFPQDSYLKLVRGYFLKNQAIALSQLNRIDERDSALNEAERVFDTMIQERPNDAGAWNGKGSVETLRGNFKQALKYIDRALKIDPTYEAARQDRERIVQQLGVRPATRKKQSLSHRRR
jgi:tetratricopeptide (TPR) repeat protein